ncbi:hypothetical protein [Biostraticola tofi]|uniref:Uncharacterized protein n=1 Tax=Biostraticola tofi TaxID=466109 RepID=A0A4R3YLH2_9GAMM|nr:hypothetical protein [Biostraticola tofi]TCV91904.1 hypothetical protein EDC52_1149 [Biostraticola tofi]
MRKAILAKAYDYQSNALAEYRERSLQLLRETEEAASPVSRLAPLVWKIFGMQQEFNAYRHNLSAGLGAAYVAWLDRVAEK